MSVRFVSYVYLCLYIDFASLHMRLCWSNVGAGADTSQDGRSRPAAQDAPPCITHSFLPMRTTSVNDDHANQRRVRHPGGECIVSLVVDSHPIAPSISLTRHAASLHKVHRAATCFGPPTEAIRSDVTTMSPYLHSTPRKSSQRPFKFIAAPKACIRSPMLDS